MKPQELRRMRDSAGLSQKALAKAIGYTKGYISNLENGHQPITPSLSARLDAFFEKGEIIKPVEIHHHRNSKGRFASAPHRNDGP